MPDSKPVKLTKAQEKKAAKLRADAQAAHDFAEKVNDFSAHKDIYWLKLWARAMRLRLLTEAMPDKFTQVYSMWFNGFKVAPRPQTFSLHHVSAPFSEQALTLAQFEEASEELDTGYGMRDDYLEAVEHERRAIEQEVHARAAALAKLTDDDLRVLKLHR